MRLAAWVILPVLCIGACLPYLYTAAVLHWRNHVTPWQKRKAAEAAIAHHRAVMSDDEFAAFMAALTPEQRRQGDARLMAEMEGDDRG